MARPSVELIVGYTKTGKPQTKKYMAKPVMTLLDTIQGSKLMMKMKKVFSESDFEELTSEEFEKLTEIEKKEYNAKIEEQEENIVNQFEIVEEAATYVSEAFNKQFTAEEFLNGLESGEKGFATLSEVLGKLVAGDVDETKKFVKEKKN